MIVKVCGLTHLDDARASFDAGADYLGLVFAPRSPRFLSLDRAVELANRLREERPSAQLVGVFVDESLGRINEVVERCRLDAVQLHGSESPDVVRVLRESAGPVIKAVRVSDREDVVSAARFGATAVLLDAFVAGHPGGTGRSFDWCLARYLAPGMRLLLSGGLTPKNVEEAIRIARPWGVDVSSGVERSPGRKDHDAVRRFVRIAKRSKRGA